VMSRLHRGKKKLREKLMEYAIQEGYVSEQINSQQLSKDSETGNLE